MTEKQAKQKLIDIASAEEGYLEKNNGKNLDDKKAGAGNGNFCRYWRDVYPAFQGQPWCACFVSWCFMKAFGKDAAKKMLKHWPFVYCPTLAGMTTNKTPKKGSVVLFYRNGEYAHTGIVVAVTTTTIVTIEGNTSSANNTVIPNGGGVWRKTYDRSNLSGMTKFFIPDWGIVTGSKNTSGTETKPKEDPDKDKTPASSQTPSPSGTLNTVPNWYGTVTASSLNVRTWAGTEYPQIKSVPSLPRGAIVGVCEVITDQNADPWYYVEIVGKGVYGFVCARYIQRN